MTTIAYKAGVIAADSRVTVDTEAGGVRSFDCQKLWRRRIVINKREQEAILATAGEGPSGQLFVDKIGDPDLPLNDLRDTFVQGDADFTILILCEDGLFEVNKWCAYEKIIPTNGCYAVGSGTKVAMGAMLAGKNAKAAVEIACILDPHTFGPVHTMKLTKKPTPMKVKRKHRAKQPVAVDEPHEFTSPAE